MSILIFALIALLIIGVLLWAIQSYLPIDPPIKNLVCFVIVAIGLILVVQRSGVL